MVYANEEFLAEGNQMTEEDRDFVRKSEKFRLVTLSFYGPAELE